MKKTISIIVTLVMTVLCVQLVSPAIVYADIPAISNVQESSITLTSAVISWTTDVAATSRVVYDTVQHPAGTPDEYAHSKWDNTLVTSHGIALTGLSGVAGTTYYYRVVSQTDTAAPNTDYSIEYTFQNSDTTPPGITDLNVTSLTTSGATIVWQTDEPGTTQVEYGLDTSYSQSSTKNANLLNIHLVILDGLTPNTKYYYRVRSEDEFTNENIVTGDFTTAAFSITEISADASDTTATISWKSDDQSTSQVEYGLEISYGSTSSLDTTSVKDHCVILIGLTPDKSYHYRVISEDEHGNTVMSGDNTFSTTKDTTLPVISDVSVDNITASNAIINWMTSELATGQVEFGPTTDYGSTSTVESTYATVHAVSLTGLEPETTYHYRIKSVDSSGNEGVSEDYTFTTAEDEEGSQIRFYMWAIIIGVPVIVVSVLGLMYGRRRAKS